MPLPFYFLVQVKNILNIQDASQSHKIFPGHRSPQKKEYKIIFAYVKRGLFLG